MFWVQCWTQIEFIHKHNIHSFASSLHWRFARHHIVWLTNIEMFWSNRLITDNKKYYSIKIPHFRHYCSRLDGALLVQTMASEWNLMKMHLINEFVCQNWFQSDANKKVKWALIKILLTKYLITSMYDAFSRCCYCRTNQTLG